MIMYVVLGCEYADFCGVYSSKNKAYEALKKYYNDNNCQNFYTLEEWYDFFDISKVTLDSDIEM